MPADLCTTLYYMCREAWPVRQAFKFTGSRRQWRFRVPPVCGKWLEEVMPMETSTGTRAEFKILMIGEGGVGKSALVIRLMTGTYSRGGCACAARV